jgi:hypothetical protein
MSILENATGCRADDELRAHAAATPATPITEAV